MAELNKQKARYKKSLRHVAEYSITRALSTQEHLACLAAGQAEQTEPAQQDAPAALRVMATPIDGQARQVDRAELRQAVGAESVPLPAKRGLSSLAKFRDRIQPKARQQRPTIDPWQTLREQNHEW